MEIKSCPTMRRSRLSLRLDVFVGMFFGGGYCILIVILLSRPSGLALCVGQLKIHSPKINTIMKKVTLNTEQISKKGNITILLFTEGTVLGPKTLLEFLNVGKYVPIKHAVNKITKWNEQGANIIYLTSRKDLKEVNQVKKILLNNRFPGSHLYFREEGEEYNDIAEAIIPDILIEDNCRSIGGKRHMTITKVDKSIKPRIRSIVVEEFKGIDHLSDVISEL
jgi:hypothetical protein